MEGNSEAVQDRAKFAVLKETSEQENDQEKVNKQRCWITSEGQRAFKMLCKTGGLTGKGRLQIRI